MSKHRKREKYNSEQQRYGPVYNNPFGINPQQLISMLGGNMNGIGNILSSMNRNGFDFNSMNNNMNNNKNQNNSFKKHNNDNIEDEEESRDENIEMMLSLRKIIDPQKIEFIDKVIECYKNGLFK